MATLDLIRNIKVSQAARLLGKSEQFVRIGLQRNLLPFGVAIKNKYAYSYHISPAKFLEYTGLTMDDIKADLKEHACSQFKLRY